MSLIAEVGRKSWKSRLLIGTIYLILSIMGLCMVVPFLITVTGSVSSSFDYNRFSPFPRYLYSEKDRYVKGLENYFMGYSRSLGQMRACFPEMPAYWSSWSIIGKDTEETDRLAEKDLKAYREHPARIRQMAKDYRDFAVSYPIEDTVIYPRSVDTINFLVADYCQRWKEQNPGKNDLSKKELREKALELLIQEWEIPYENFYGVSFQYEMYRSYDHQAAFFTSDTPRGQAFNRFKKEQMAKDLVCPLASPYALRAAWYRYLQSEAITLELGRTMDIRLYNRLAGTRYETLNETPFPLPASVQGKLRELWTRFLKDRYPLRLQRFKVTDEDQKLFRQELKNVVRDTKGLQKLLGKKYDSFDKIKLTPVPSLKNEDQKLRRLWINYVKRQPIEKREYTSSEHAFQKFMLKRYGSLDKINAAWGTHYRYIEEVFPPFRAAYTVDFIRNSWKSTFTIVWKNYKMIMDYLLFNGNAIPVTAALIILTLIFTLTINPLAAYALSRFNLRGHDKIILFMLATMAFPTMVSAIPAYLLMRDLGLLNTLWALVIPGAANGMSIFILKGFFDSLPQELFEAATIDGASELQIFRVVAMPLVKPILAINCLTAFMTAYNGWGWALIICQDRSMWTIAVWLYQASTWWVGSPWLVSAGFILASVPTIIVFLSCQKIILKGIVIPTMK